MFSETDIIAKAWMVQEVVNLVLRPEGQTVDRIYLVGSYAHGTPTDWSDLDFLVQLKGGNIYPTWQQIVTIQKKLSRRIHVIFGTKAAQESLLKKNGKEYVYRELQLPMTKGDYNAELHTAVD